jgi:hypothetical protein
MSCLCLPNRLMVFHKTLPHPGLFPMNASWSVGSAAIDGGYDRSVTVSRSSQEGIATPRLVEAWPTIQGVSDLFIGRKESVHRTSDAR